MSKRKKVCQRKSCKVFTRHALKVNKRNVAPPPMRGGYRI